MIEELKQHALDSGFNRLGGEISTQAMTIDQWDAALTGVVGNATDATDTSNLLKTTSGQAVPHYADEIPPFDITVTFQNEYGQRAVLVVYACEILNEGSGYSIDSVASEKEYTFVARRIDYLRNPDKLDTSSSVANTILNAVGL